MFESFVEIPIKGKHTFLLVFALPNSLAYSLASIFFQLSVSEVSKEDAQDSLQEIANILAGRIQRQLSEETTLDVPVKLSKDKALALMQGIEPDWEIILKDGQTPLYAGVFVANTTHSDKPN